MISSYVVCVKYIPKLESMNQRFEPKELPSRGVLWHPIHIHTTHFLSLTFDCIHYEPSNDMDIHTIRHFVIKYLNKDTFTLWYI